jgi:hypothetical protein
MTGDGKQFLGGLLPLRASGPCGFDVWIRLQQAGVDREHDERAGGGRIRVPRDAGWTGPSTGDMTEGKVPAWAELKEK